MSNTRTNQRQSLFNDGATSMPGDSGLPLRRRLTGAYLLDMEKELAWTNGAVLQEFRVTRVKDQWRVMVKAEIRGNPMVTFIYTDSYTDGLDMLQYLIAQGMLPWSQDKYPVKKFR